MLRTKLAALAAVSAAGLALGIAAPASAAPQAPEALLSGTAFSGNNGGGTATGVTANASCQTVSGTVKSASTDLDAVLPIVWYPNVTDCQNITGGVIVLPGFLVDFGSTSRPVYRAVV